MAVLFHHSHSRILVLADNRVHAPNTDEFRSLENGIVRCSLIAPNIRHDQLYRDHHGIANDRRKREYFDHWPIYDERGCKRARFSAYRWDRNHTTIHDLFEWLLCRNQHE